MSRALASHDKVARTTVGRHHGNIVKMTGDGMVAVFADPVDALDASLTLQLALADPIATNGVVLRVRCGLHAGVVERRDRDIFGTVVNRAARIMGAAHGGQVLLSQAVVDLVGDQLQPQVSLRDLGTVRLRNLANPEHLYQLVDPRLRQDFPALRSLEATPNNLPQQVTSFIGRERELGEIKKLIAKTRLLTLIGTGGIGKSRLSLQLAADIVDDYPDGVWFVELAPVADAWRVPQALASVIGVKEEAGRPVLEALIKCVQDRELLIVLDNCEHLVHACAELAKQLLQAGPRLKVLASSREPLHVAGEATYPVPPLAIPDRHQAIAFTESRQWAAVQLFSERALAVHPTFKVTQQNSHAVIEICRRLDGIPLAIELAAARVRALSVEKIAARLTDRFRLLTGGDRTALPRQQTLRALIEWSYELLTEAERMLLERLAVFVGGWTLEAAEAVGSGGEIDEADVLDLLTHLVEKSLVGSEAEGERYGLLETVREYVLEKLNESGEADGARVRHLAFYLALAEAAEPKLFSPEQGVWLARLDLEQENLLAAHESCDRAEGGAVLGLRLAHSLQSYYVNRGLLGLGHRVAVEALARVGANERSDARCLALVTASQLGAFIGLHREAQGYAEECLSIAREIGDKQKVWMALQVLGIACSAQGDQATAKMYFEEALALAREGGPTFRIAATLHNLAVLHGLERDLETAERLYEEALAIMREQGVRSGNMASTLSSLAILSIARGSGDRAREMLLEALEVAGKIGSKFAGPQAIAGSAHLAAFTGDWVRAAGLYGAAEAQSKQMGLHGAHTDEALLAPLIDRARAALGVDAFSAAETAGRGLSYEEAMAEARAWLEGTR